MKLKIYEKEWLEICWKEDDCDKCPIKHSCLKEPEQKRPWHGRPKEDK